MTALSPWGCVNGHPSFSISPEQLHQLELPPPLPSRPAHQTPPSGLHHPNSSLDLCAVLQGEPQPLPLPGLRRKIRISPPAPTPLPALVESRSHVEMPLLISYTLLGMCYMQDCFLTSCPRYVLRAPKGISQSHQRCPPSLAPLAACGHPTCGG